MATMIESENPLTTPASLLAETFRRQGYVPGLPAHITPLGARIDRELCADMDCPDCGRHGLEYHPFQGDSKYRVLCLCAHCGHGEEL